MKKLLCLFILLFALNVYAQFEKNVQLSIAGTFMTEAQSLYFAEIDRYRYVGDAFIFKAELDYFLDSFSKNFGIGIFANIGSPYYGIFEETSMTEFGPSIKWKIEVNQAIFLVPSLYIGYRSYEDEAGEGLGINLSAKAAFPQKKWTPFIEIGFLSQAAGGNDATDITFEPVFIVGGGVGIGL